MGKISRFRARKRMLKVKKANSLYREGLSLREVGEQLDMSHEWVRGVLNV